MTMMLSDSDVALLLRFATECAVSAVGVPPVSQTARADLTSRDPDLSESLTAFERAYRAWYDFHKTIDAAGRQGALTGPESMTLIALIGARDSTRDTFLQRLNEARQKH